MHTLTLAPALILAVAAVASAQTAKLDPCSLLTQAEIKTAIGMEIGVPKINTTMGAAAGTLCDFKVGDAGAGGILLRTLTSVETPQKIRAESEKAKIVTSDATGYGPGAFYAVGSYGVVQLNAFKGSTHVMVQVMLFTSSQDGVKAALGKLMAAALPKVR